MDKEIYIDHNALTKVNTPYISLCISEGLIHCTYIGNLNINLEMAKQCVSERIAFSNGKSSPCLFDIQGIKSISKEAREYFAVEGIELITAGALITKSIFSKMIGTIFLTINKPKVPTKLFSNEKDAIIWLRKYL